MHFIILSQPLKVRQMRRKVIQWFSWMIATATGGLFESRRMAALVGRPSLHYPIMADDKGYLPAEHIETPTERLARLNKHRNVDVSYTIPVPKEILIQAALRHDAG